MRKQLSMIAECQRRELDELTQLVHRSPVVGLTVENVELQKVGCEVLTMSAYDSMLDTPAQHPAQHTMPALVSAQCWPSIQDKVNDEGADLKPRLVLLEALDESLDGLQSDASMPMPLAERASNPENALSAGQLQAERCSALHNLALQNGSSIHEVGAAFDKDDPREHLIKLILRQPDLQQIKLRL